jgi:hypothetical protein
MEDDAWQAVWHRFPFGTVSRVELRLASMYHPPPAVLQPRQFLLFSPCVPFYACPFLSSIYLQLQ